VGKIASLPEAERAVIEADIAAAYAKGPGVAMVDSDRGITNLHVPSDVIVDASMPAMIRTSGQMWNAAGKLQDTKACSPTAATPHLPGGHRRLQGPRRLRPGHHGQRAQRGPHGQKAEEYGSHDKTFEIKATAPCGWSTPPAPRCSSTPSSEGDIWRACQTKDAPVRDWVKLAVRRARATGTPGVFWLDAAAPTTRRSSRR
jgi:isocitrate dehydrogenase